MSQLLGSKTYVASDGSVPVTAPLVSANSPAFSAYPSAVTSLSQNIPVLVTFGNAEYNVGGFFNTSTSWFAPTVAGYYQISTAIQLSTTNAIMLVSVYKNSAIPTEYKKIATNSGSTGGICGSCLVYLDGTGTGPNGSCAIYCLQSATTQNNTTAAAYNYFQAALLIRTA